MSDKDSRAKVGYDDFHKIDNDAAVTMNYHSRKLH